MNASPRLVLAAMLVALLAGSARLEAGEPASVAVTLRSGRTFTASLDARTDGELLWLRFDGPRSTWYRPVLWEAVTSARVGNRELTADELRAGVTELVSTRATLAELPPTVEIEEAPPAAPLPGEWPLSRPVVVVQTPTPGVVANVQVDAQIANWDSDVEPDGLLVSILPLDGYGVPVLAAGTLEVELIGEALGPASPFGGFLPLGRWVFQVTPNQFGPGGATFRCPFQALDPEYDLFVAPRALANVRLSVPGAGTFESTTGATRIRQVNPIRDRLQIESGQRFFPGERTGRGVGAAWPYGAGR